MLRPSAIVALATGLVLGAGCAQIRSTSKVEIITRAKAEPIVLGPPYGQVTAQGVDTRWQQDGDRLEIHLAETRRCSAVRHEPVVRIERITRTAGGALYWEYGLAAVTLGLGLTGLIRPELFSQRSVNADGESVEDLRAGYRVGGIFTGISAVALGAGIYDTVRARDEVRYSDAYRVHVGGATECGEPSVPLGEHSVELIIGKWRSEEPTDADGRVRFLLPPADELQLPPLPDAPAPEPAAAVEETAAVGGAAAVGDVSSSGDAAAGDIEAPPPEPAPVPIRMAKAVLRIDPSRALTVDFVVPYDAPEARAHAGELAIDPVPVSSSTPQVRDVNATKARASD